MAEFGIQKSGQKIAGLLFILHDVHAASLASAQGVLLTEPFCWNMNDGPKTFTKRFDVVHARQYSTITHDLKAIVAVDPDKIKASGRAITEQMKAAPTGDPLYGRAIPDM